MLSLSTFVEKKTINNLRCSTDKQHSVNLGLDSLQCRRVNVDLSFCYKLLHGLADIKSDGFIVLSRNINLRGNKYTLVKIMKKSPCQSFCDRAMNIWNCLPDDIVLVITNIAH